MRQRKAVRIGVGVAANGESPPAFAPQLHAKGRAGLDRYQTKKRKARREGGARGVGCRAQRLPAGRARFAQATRHGRAREAKGRAGAQRSRGWAPGTACEGRHRGDDAKACPHGPGQQRPYRLGARAKRPGAEKARKAAGGPVR